MLRRGPSGAPPRLRCCPRAHCRPRPAAPSVCAHGRGLPPSLLVRTRQCGRVARRMPALARPVSAPRRPTRATGPTRAGPRASTCSRRSSTSSSTCRRTTPTTRTSACTRAATATRCTAAFRLNSNPDPAGNEVRVFHGARSVPERSRRLAVVDGDAPADRQRTHGRVPRATGTPTPCATGTARCCRSTGRSRTRSHCAIAGSRRRRRRPIRTACTSRPERRRTSSPPTSPRRSRCRTRRAERSGRSSARTASRGSTTRGISRTSCSVPEGVEREPRQGADVRPVPRRLPRRHAARGLDREPRCRRVHRGEPERHPARRGVQRVDHQRRHGEPRVAEDGTALHVRRARRLLRPRSRRRPRCRPTTSRPVSIPLRARRRRGTPTASASPRS